MRLRGGQLRAVVGSMLGVLLGLMPHVVGAFSFTPERLFIDIAPGKERVEQFQLYNETGAPVIAEVRVQAFVRSTEAGKPQFTDAPVATSIEPFVLPSTQKLRLEAGERKPFPFTVRIPKDALAGSYYGAIHFAFAPVDGGNGAIAVTGPLVFVTVSGKQESALMYVSSDALPQISGWMPHWFGLTLRNDGALVEVPSGDVSITNVFGTKVKGYVFNAERGAMLPGDVKNFEVGDETFAGGIREEFMGLGIGPYTVSAKIIAKDERVQHVVLGRVWVFPWRLSGIIVGIALFLGVVLTVLFPRYGRKSV